MRWLDLYVMLSRVTRLEDLLLIRAPPIEWFAAKPHKNLLHQLGKLTKKTNECRRVALKLAKELGLATFLRDD